MTTFDTGRLAETKAAEHLSREGYSVLQQNWRTRWCEIDIVAAKNQTIYFVEVKYRRSSYSGDGLDYITPKKLQQMSFAAEFWCTQNRWPGSTELVAVSVTGPQLIIDRVIFI